MATLASILSKHPVCYRACIPSRYIRSLHSSLVPARHLSTSSSVPTSPTAPSPEISESAQVYYGPLAGTFRRLKLFSLGSLSLSCLLSPFIFIVESALPMSARIVLAATALGTSGISTGLVGWVGMTYVTELRRIGGGSKEKNAGASGIEMTTYTLGLHKHITRVYDTSFLVPTERPLAKWQLAQRVVVPLSSGPGAPSPGTEETIAEVLGSGEEVVGRWIVKWELSSDGNGVMGHCRGVGKVVRHFLVHEELIEFPIG